MDTNDIRTIRLHNHLLTTHELKSPKDVVSWMGAMQAQLYTMAKWAIGLRLPGSTDGMIEQAINDGDIIRTHILRPTWHFVSSDDIHWMLELTAPRIKAILLNYNKSIGEDEALLSKMLLPVERILTKESHLTRQEIGERLKAEGTDIDNRRLSHIMSWAELEGVVCNGKVRGSKQTYCLLQEKAPKTFSLTKEEALERLARKYFNSHGPATIKDFVWWSGLLTSDARKGIESIKHEFTGETIGSETYWFRNNIQLPSADTTPSALLLPAFDEYLVGYRGRLDILKEEYTGTVITKTGIFSPILTLNGEIIGTWKNKKTDTEHSFFQKEKKEIQELFKSHAEVYKAYRNT
ncbi:MAG: winged helix DNA-binding domain-containing protein [Tannerellaceae bacterium]|jgi:hypothetical protein|nr:winged helix DNA-binding domain-containing protein [Tannerellaceae bacterium]